MTDPLAKVAAIVTSLRAPRGTSPTSSGVRWWLWPLVGVLVLVGLAVAAWYGAADRRELARLRHEEVKRRVELEEAAVDQTLARSMGEMARAQLAEDRALLALAAAQAEEAELLARMTRDRDSVRALRWGDLPRGTP